MGTLGKAIYTVGFWIRDRGQALDRLGCGFQGKYYFKEQCIADDGGNPAKFLSNLTEEEIAFISQSAISYSNLAQVHAAANAKSFDEIEFEKVLHKKKKSSP
ncbi:gamma carbonic anhydrase 1 mitochondrial-like [Tripterygium wilfordii]|uniref:Gamma carbonic anhydrase 1 mitochondrial-like n=1 Tax=Tripterygium wilfordii TaxID=458696 RepID=A0A7J7CPK0_TRIWF|nr:gamma carbonic anhydrase 1 mitochondrial-like [Tripterygium wilfordii]